jgi:hydroxymethylbilane synthase
MAPTSRHVRLGTRGSPMALWQARWVAAALRQQHAGLTTEIVVIRTAGDRNRRDPLPRIGGKGLFVKDIEDALLRQEIDLAVHSMKDVPTTLPPGLHLSAVPPRDDVRDAFVGRDGRRLTNVPRLSETPGPWRIGTSSLRRRAQLLVLHPQLQVQDIRGNVDTRLRKMRQGEVDGVVVAAAGMCRLGLQTAITELLPVDVMLPAAGQGALGIETLAGHWIDDLLQALHDPTTAAAVTAERAFLWHLGGGCTVPIAALAQCQGAELYMQGLVSTPDGSQLLRQELRGPVQEPAQLGERLAAQMRASGAGALLKALQDDLQPLPAREGQEENE